MQVGCSVPSAPSRIAASKDARVFSRNRAEAYGTGLVSEEREEREERETRGNARLGLGTCGAR